MKKQVLTVMLLAACCAVLAGGRAPKERPNILWITIEDWCPDLSCYGTPGIWTPHLDKLASEGMRFNWAFTTAPVCSASRSAMMTGFHQDYIGAGQHRLKKEEKKPLPHGVQPVPKLFEQAGYFTALMSWKTDVNFLPCDGPDLFMGTDWNQRKPGQPFFARITIGGTHRSWVRDPARPIDTKDIELPPYYPDTEFCRRDFANGLEQMQLVDREVADLLKRVDDEGLRDNTIVFFIADHGRCHVRGKQFLYDEGLHIPMIVRWPGTVKPGTVNDDLVMAIDIDATILDAAGITPPVPLHGKNLFGKAVKNRKYVFASRNKMDETHDAMRAVRSKEWKLIRNLMPERPYLQFNRYKEGGYPMLAEMNVLYMEGKLTPEQAAFMAPTKPEFELYHLTDDPYEMHNLADDPEFADVKAELIRVLEDWRKNVIEDPGVSAAFRAEGVFPAKCPLPTVEKWVEANQDKYDFNQTGWPAWYPTRTLEEWKKVRKIWEPWVFRKPGEEVEHPQAKIVWTKRKKKNTKHAKSEQYFTKNVVPEPKGAAK